MTNLSSHDHRDPSVQQSSGNRLATAVLEVTGLHWASEKAIIEATLGRLEGVRSVETNPVAQTATVSYDPSATNVGELRHWIEECGYHCAGQSVPGHVCHPMNEPRSGGEAGRGGAHGAHGADAPQGAGEPAVQRSPHDVMGHGGHGGGVSMADMVADMRRRFLVAAVFSVPVLLWSPIGRDVLNFGVVAPFGLRDDVFMLLWSLPAIFYSAWIFFDGAFRALRARTLDMMVLVAVAVGAGCSTHPGSPSQAAVRSSTKPPPSCRRSCSSGTGSRCAPGAARTMPSGPSWSLHRRGP